MSELKLNRFEAWVRDAEPGDQILYLQSDTAQRDRKTATFFYEAAKRGEVFLFQKRVRFGIFNYYARRITPKTGEIMKPEEYY